MEIQKYCKKCLPNDIRLLYVCVGGIIINLIPSQIIYHALRLYSSANILTLLSEARSSCMTSTLALGRSARILSLHFPAFSIFLQAITTVAPWKARDLAVSYPEI